MIGVGRREYQSRPVGEDGRPPLAYWHYRRERRWLSRCASHKDARGLFAEVIQPVGVYRAVILALLGLAPVNATQWLASHISPEAVSWVSSDKGRWIFVGAG